MAYFFYLLMSAWYRARTINHFASCTHFDNATFKGTASGFGLIWIDFTNILILLAGALVVIVLALLIIALVAGLFVGFSGVTPEMLANPEFTGYAAGVAGPILGIIIALSFTLLLPVTQSRSMGYFIDHLSLEGSVDVDKIGQSTAAPMSTGEGLAQAFDVDAF